MRLHEVSKNIVSDKDIRFVLAFWQSLQRSMGTRLAFSIIYHPQMNGQIERVNWVIEDMLKTYCMDQRAIWVDMLPLMEFVYNNNY